MLNLEFKNFRKSTSEWASDSHAEVDVYLNDKKISTYSWNPFWNAKIDFKPLSRMSNTEKWLRSVRSYFVYRYNRDAKKFWEMWLGKTWSKILIDRVQKEVTAAVWEIVTPVFPNVEDVESCLVSDALCVEEALDFEDFCNDLGYDSDSRKAENIYRECQKIYAILVRTGKWEELKKEHEND